MFCSLSLCSNVIIIVMASSKLNVYTYLAHISGTQLAVSIHLLLFLLNSSEESNNFLSYKDIYPVSSS